MADNETKKSTPTPSGTRIVAIVVVVLVMALIAFMKYTTKDATSMPDAAIKADSVVVKKEIMAVPDVSSPLLDTLAKDEDTVAAGDYSLYLTDTASVSVDHRSPDAAGYEDGYSAGREDAAVKKYKETYDETNVFVGEANKIYAERYKMGYEDGFQRNLNELNPAGVDGNTY